MLQNLKKKQEGFTIIEVMIVLVIAAVILLIVFLAVPALQRNSRNTQKKNVAADILSATSEYSSNNAGKVLVNSSSANCPDQATCTTAAGQNGATDATKILALVNTNGLITNLTIRAQGNSGLGNNPSPTTAFIETNATCNGSSTQAGNGPRQIAIIYPVENSSSTPQPACASSGL